ncbi:DUF5819 family protein [Streptomyces mayonensis]|uniref:DUF5819 family protein n=1 Tax=Streptomyces mayonensis TaxID=2750816 RepID=UPI001C1E401D|nr:DUF5819 family protein [Streptomyces sp. A108]MBU6532214.1 hypothetical protein [Streptomyces sp. A108]
MDAYDKGSDARQGPGRDGREGPPPGPDGAPEQTGGADGADGAAGTAGTTGTAGTVEVPEAAEAEVPEAADTSRAGEAVEAGAEAGPGTGTSTGTGTTGTGSGRGSGDGHAAPPAAAVASASPAPSTPPTPRTGVAALSPRYQVGAVVALAVVAVAVCAHIGLVFLHVAPSNTLTKQHGSAVDEWVFPEFEQNWKLFAPNPLQQNVSVQVRAEVSTADGAIRTTGWYDLSAEDGRAIDGNPLPSHTQQNELRRAWDFFVSSHDSENRPVGLRGSLSGTYLRRIALLRLDRNEAAGPGGVVERVQYRSRTTNVEPPPWSGEKVSDRPTYRELPWWSVTPERDTKERDTKEGGAA